MRKNCLIGRSLGHSWSKKWFDEMFAREGVGDATYTLYELPTLEGLRAWAAEEGLRGFNVTIPYKEEVLPLLDGLDAAAGRIGAVNCVEVVRGRLIGHNTDAPAFARSLRPLLRPWHTRALVLGTGGASKAVVFALGQLGIGCTLVSRTPGRHPSAISYAQAQTRVADTFLIVNCTPAGMYPDTAATPWPDMPPLGQRHLCYDLVYNPAPTLFLQAARSQGAATMGGLAMLEEQARLSWQCWNGAVPTPMEN